MSKQAFEDANEAFVDDKYEQAYELYTKAFESDEKTDNQFTSKVLAARAQCALKLRKYADALSDSNNAIQLDETNVKAYLRKGTALYNQDSKDEALKAFARGLEIDGIVEKNLCELSREFTIFLATNDQLKTWKEKCEKDLEEKKSTATEEKDKPAAAAAPIPPAKIKHSFYQSDSTVNIQIPIKGLKKDQVQVQTTDTTLSVSTKVPATGNDYSLEIDLAYPIDSSRTSFNVTGSNIEIKLLKKQALQWSSLDAQSSANKNQPPVPMSGVATVKAPTYPSSSQRAKDWNKVEASIKQDEKDNKEDMGDANSIFQQLYRDSDENTRRAMNKSMYESGGTCLNMNWEEVSKGKISCEPPDGMEWKKYDS
ncbi:unnamed protein product [Adineta ricciae]|uniref:Uncharacterized protein n=1 Tax=Adineta ricciae TaxID=249248 RepID=A0A813SAX2_ADIRI|nr:unnamed protein product [Adineta ricciae]CAF1115152.1 unnamed protein product [Adineta ricciae]